MGLSGGSSKRLRNTVAAKDQTTMVRLHGEPGSLSFSRLPINSALAPTIESKPAKRFGVATENVAWSRGSWMIQKAKLWQIQKDCDQIFLKFKKLLELWQCFLLRIEYGFWLQVCKPPKYGDHAELLMASCLSRCRIASSKRGIPECKPGRYI